MTVGGVEAGAVAAAHHTRSGELAPLLGGAVLQSGGPRDSWARLDRTAMLDRSAALQARLGCPPGPALQCLQTVPLQDILDSQAAPTNMHE